MVEVHGGLLFWSVITFLLLLVVLKKVAWGPILSALESREEEIKNALSAAEKAKEHQREEKIEWVRRWEKEEDQKYVERCLQKVEQIARLRAKEEEEEKGKREKKQSQRRTKEEEKEKEIQMERRKEEESGKKQGKQSKTYICIWSTSPTNEQTD